VRTRDTGDLGHAAACGRLRPVGLGPQDTQLRQGRDNPGGERPVTTGRAGGAISCTRRQASRLRKANASANSDTNAVGAATQALAIMCSSSAGLSAA
jgi:hypothetical protein